MKYLLDRLKEGSSWAGLGGLLLAFGVNIDAELLQQISTVGAAIAGAIAFALRDKVSY